MDPYHLAKTSTVNGFSLRSITLGRTSARLPRPGSNPLRPTGQTFERTQKFSLEKRLRDSFGVHSGEGEFDVVIRFNARVAD